MDAVATNLYHALVDALHARGDASPDRPVTVAEIYQELVPYRGVRETLGFELNADYEHALLRLLSGEGDLLRLEPSTARDELREELQSPNPYVGLYRKFAACDVWVKLEPRAGAQDTAPAAAPITTAPAPEVTAPLTAAPPATPAASPAVSPDVVVPPAVVVPPSDQPHAADTASDLDPSTLPANCPFCHEAMPTGRVARYCPHCGGDQRSRPCARCGEVLDYAWRYCISCGAAATSGTQPAGGIG